MPDRPRIGIATSLTEGEQRLDRRYVLAVERAGGLPMLVPMAEDADVLKAFCELLDGVVIPGGPAIAENVIGDVPGDLPSNDPARDASDRILLREAMLRHLPILGICYGMQLINVLAGGRLYADVEAQLEGCAPHSEKRGGADHAVRIEPGSHLRRIAGADELIANTRHIQALADVAPGLIVTGRAPDDVVEAVESEDGRIVGVQFHPERMGDDGLPFFVDLVQKAMSMREPSTPRIA